MYAKKKNRWKHAMALIHTTQKKNFEPQCRRMLRYLFLNLRNFTLAITIDERILYWLVLMWPDDIDFHVWINLILI